MKKQQKLLKRISSKLTANQALLCFATCGIVAVIVFVNDVKDYKIDIPHTLIGVLFCVLTFIFAYISIEKTAEYLIKRETKKILDEIEQLLSDEYKLVKYDDVSEIFELYENARKMNKQRLYAKLDANNNICYAIIDNAGNIITKRKSKKYRFFLENVYVYFDV